jgi:hypothetical protein
MNLMRIMTGSVIQDNGPEAGFREHGNEQVQSIKIRNLFTIERLLASVPFFLQQIT